MPRNFMIPLTTCRGKRIDDDPKYLINLTTEEFQKSQFFINCEMSIFIQLSSSYLN
ncbi:hypothetical protein [Wolbachia endosymbiont (group A) of Pogonocherus hispidulus]|uniref:hypothetical protein n=1 Tax=Wolbachia endosymbiont (group A) of Pogonocherus hispidulus TaxID=3066136 RepID=UPI003342E005